MQHYIDSVTAFNGDKITDAVISLTTLAGNGVTIYLDEAGSMPVSFVNTNSNGEFDFYVPSGRYNITVSGSGISSYVLSDVFIFYPNNDVIPVISGGTGVTTSTGTGSVVLNTSPTLVTPILGTPASGNLANCTGISVTTVSGILPVANGGTNKSSYTIGDIIYASGATTLSSLVDVATGNAIISGGVGASPSYGKINLTTHISDTLAVGNGGTGVATISANAVILGNNTSAVQTVAPSTTGNVLTSNGTTWASTPPAGGAQPIQPIAASVGSSALTCTLNPTTLNFRNTPLTSGTINSRTVATAISVVVPSTATLGTVSAQQSRLVLLALDNAGTVELAVVNISGSTNLDETTLISTTAIIAGSNSTNVVYSTTARTSLPFRVVGYVESTQATAGTWATAPTTIQGQGGQALAAMSSLGYNQTWQVVTGSRALSTTYYNTTGKPIYVLIDGLAGAIGFVVNGNTGLSGGGANNYSFIVPINNSYSATASSVARWSELR